MKKEFAMSLSQSYRQDLLNATQLAEQGMLSPSQQAFVHIIINSNDVVISSSATFCKICFFSRTFSIFRVVLI